MSVKILEDASFGILRTNPKITGNVKVVVDSSNNTFIESISANDELSKSKYKAVKTSASSGYQFDIARVFGNTPTDIFFDVKKPSSDYSQKCIQYQLRGKWMDQSTGTQNIGCILEL